jgi:endonuclease/exonuclease/phosphatase family metal-dependent hydrolase
MSANNALATVEIQNIPDNSNAISGVVNAKRARFDIETKSIEEENKRAPINLVLNLDRSRSSFRVLTYNLWCHRLVGGRHSAQRLNTFAAWLLNNSTQFYDTICLQEVFVCNPLLLLNYGSGQRANLIKTVKSKYPYSYTADAPWFGVQDSGCLILSAHKIEPCHQEPFSGYSLSELVTHKGYICCKITIANKDLIVINTHLNAGMQTSAAVRARQLEQINDHITTCHAGHRVILCGDLNIEYGSKEYNDMLKSLFINRLMDCTPKAAATYARSIRLDYILTNQYFSPTGSAVVSADEKNQNDPKLMVSDHEGLEATLKFTSSEPPNAQITIVPRPNKARARQIKGLTAFLATVLSAIIYYYLFQSQDDSYY